MEYRKNEWRVDEVSEKQICVLFQDLCSAPRKIERNFLET